ncbi:MAG: substrate-binding domain-containing protein, partial [Anaerolineaceae bacterium]|nr:substrate-binding domain-containing protein [Anaerolineaceae bacterium]
MRKILGLVLITVFLLSACAPAASTEPTQAVVEDATQAVAEETANPLEGVPAGVTPGLKIAVIRNLPSDDHTKQFLDGARSEGESFGFVVDTFIADNDDVKFQDLVAQAIQKGYDGLIISHGKADYSYDMLKPAVDAGIKVVTFDTVIDKDGVNLPEITTTFQDDFALAELSLTEIAALSK